jgi:putative transposase
MSDRCRHRKTRQTWNEPGHAHELTSSCLHRWQLLSKDRTRTWFLEGLEAARRRWNIAVWAYVIMPEHVHLLVWPRDPDYDASMILKGVKQSVSRRAVAYLRERSPAWLERLKVVRPSGRTEYRLWEQGGGYDRNIIREDAAWQAIEYIHLNPVRRGLVQQPTDWPWSSARAYAGMRPLLFEIDEPPLAPSPTGWTRKPVRQV